jgi:L-seryl-tRNA(Ser) seleniumtransferase
MEALKSRADKLVRLIVAEAPKIETDVHESQSFLGSGSLPTEAIPSFAVAVAMPGLGASELARRLRLDRACIFGRIKDDRVLLDVRTLTEEQVALVATAVSRCAL